MMQDVLTMAASNPVDHVVNQPYWVGRLFGIDNVWLWSAHVGNLFLAGILTVMVLMHAAGRIATGPASQGTDRFVTRGSFAHMIEVIITYLQESSIRPLLGDRTARFMPFLMTVFFFILLNNLLGLVPIIDATHLIDSLTGSHALTGLVGATATQNLFVTAALALIAALVINVSGIMTLGLGEYLKHLTAGTRFPVSLLLVPIEIVGTVIKPVALALRLFANMTAGHILVAVLLMFAVSGLGILTRWTAGGVVMGGAITVVSIIATVAIYFLELFVAFLQAFVFMFLTTVFISLLSHHGEHEHHDEHGHEHAHAQAH
ncbi:MAG: F0F1 ATP synthase subunit A [Phycisphaeraceae bacterium]|nr:F0F1 ATP synthase subunit A [Phycisphaerae bacterium]MBX3392539.1 F0F1 ATP synthase subunit A [Phycisphaeraceae bacterium]HRJ49064.1 F0F1 ATP synthase subunit A [Phycisphaerales bacterium]